MSFSERIRGIAKPAFGLLRKTATRFVADQCSRMAAALAYYTMFSLAPLLLVCMWVAGMFFESQRVERQMTQEMARFIGPAASAQVQQMIEHAGSRDHSQTAARVGSIALLVFGATGLMAQLQVSLNEIWRVEVQKGNAIKRIVMKRALSFGMVLLMGLLLLASIILNMWLTGVSQVARGWLGSGLLEGLAVYGSFLISFAVTLALLAIVFKYLPDAEIAWRHVAAGALLTAVMFSIGRWVLGLYLGGRNLGSLYGAAGSLVLVLAWVYYSTMILLLGAEFTYLWAHRKGEFIPPSAGATRARPRRAD